MTRNDVVRLRPGVFAAPSRVAPEAWQQRRDRHLLVARAAAVACPRAVLSHVAASLTFELPALLVPRAPCLSVPAGTALRSLENAHLHRVTLTRDDVVEVGGDRVTSPQRTVMDVARELGVDAAVVTADAALHRGLVTAGDLADAVEQCRGWPGRKAARVVLMSVDGRSESPLESLSRLRIRAEGLPAPEPQVWIYDRARNRLGRADFYWDEFGVVGEADGDLKYRDVSDLTAERAREKLLAQTGLVVVRWGSHDIDRFAATAERLRDAFTRGAAPGSPLRRWLWQRTALHPAESPIRPAGPN